MSKSRPVETFVLGVSIGLTFSNPLAGGACRLNPALLNFPLVQTEQSVHATALSIFHNSAAPSKLPDSN